MKKIEIYDPAMCCSTGVCGPSIDQELLRVSTLVDSLTKNGANITRYNLSSQPQAFISNEEVNRLLREDNDILPITMVDGNVVKTKSYLTNKEFSFYTGMIIVSQPIQETACCSTEEAQTGGCCCSAQEEEPCCSSEEAKSSGCCGSNQEGCC